MSLFKIESIQLDADRGHHVRGTVVREGKSETTRLTHEGRVTPEEQRELDAVLEKIAARISNALKEEIPQLLS